MTSSSGLGSVLFTMLVAWAVFFVIAFLMNYLSGNLRKTREALRTAQKELIIKERLAEAGRVSATLAHEIRNPLAAISGSVQVMRNDLALGDANRALMDIVVRESERVSQSIDQFLDFAAPGKEPIAEVNVADLLDETLTMLRSCGELNGNIRLEGNHSGTELRFVASANQFKQVFWNLTKNAIKAMPGGGTLTIDLQKAKGALKIRFADTGIGMTAEDKAHIFEPFYSGFENGRGLGMANVRRIVDDYEGTDRRPLRARQRDRDPHPTAVEPEERARPQDLTMENILIVDDEKSLLDLLSVVFKKEGYGVKTASSGVQALRSSRKRPSTSSSPTSRCPRRAAWTS